MVAGEICPWSGYEGGQLDQTHYGLENKVGATGSVFLNAVQARDAKPLMDAGDALNTACENCLKVFWYPST